MFIVVTTHANIALLTTNNIGFVKITLYEEYIMTH